MSPSKETLDLIQKGDQKSQREFYDHFKSTVMGICRKYTATKEEAEDVFQDAFIRAFQNIDQLNDLAKIEPWIKRIAVNTSVNFYHKNKKHQHAEEKNGYHKYDGEYELILSHFSDEMLLQMINDLPVGYRMVFNLHVMEGYDHHEIGEMLQINEASSRSQLTRAKIILRNRLNAVGIVKYEKYE